MPEILSLIRRILEDTRIESILPVNTNNWKAIAHNIAPDIIRPDLGGVHCHYPLPFKHGDYWYLIIKRSDSANNPGDWWIYRAEKANSTYWELVKGNLGPTKNDEFWVPSGILPWGKNKYLIFIEHDDTVNPNHIDVVELDMSNPSDPSVSIIAENVLTASGSQQWVGTPTVFTYGGLLVMRYHAHLTYNGISGDHMFIAVGSDPFTWEKITDSDPLLPAYSGHVAIGHAVPISTYPLISLLAEYDTGQQSPGGWNYWGFLIVLVSRDLTRAYVMKDLDISTIQSWGIDTPLGQHYIIPYIDPDDGRLKWILYITEGLTDTVESVVSIVEHDTGAKL